MRSGRRRALTAAIAVALAAALAACGGSSGSSSAGGGEGAGGAKANGGCQPAGKPVTIQYWNWVPGMDKVVAKWNAANPDIKVEIKDISNNSWQQLSNAIKAGNPPELGQITYDGLPMARTQDGLVDVSACEPVKDAGGKFVDWAWGQTSFSGDGVFAIPQDTGPMMMFYRADLFDKYGLTVPKTWDEYYEQAKKLAAATSKTKITFFDPANPTAFNGFLWQAGSEMYSYKDNAWQVGVDNPESIKVADYWNRMLQEKLVRTDVKNTSAPMYKAFNDDQLATVFEGAWGYSLIRDNLPDQSGKWRVAPMPQWDATKTVGGNYGGSSVAFMKGGKHPYEAAKFAMWLNSDPEALAMTLELGGLYPAATAGLDLPELQKPVAYYGDTKIFDTVKEVATTVNTEYQWGPVQSDADQAMTDEMTKVVAGSGTLGSAMHNIQSTVMSAMSAQGLTAKAAS